jgi:hypothetical protein
MVELLCRFGVAYSVVRLDEGVVYGDDVDVVVLDAAGTVSSGTAVYMITENTYALRKTIRPMRPKPLIPTYEKYVSRCVRASAG